jgi:hypothetical protein
MLNKMKTPHAVLNTIGMLITGSLAQRGSGECTWRDYSGHHAAEVNATVVKLRRGATEHLLINRKRTNAYN